jgi:hypothetical protein
MCATFIRVIPVAMVSADDPPEEPPEEPPDEPPDDPPDDPPAAILFKAEESRPPVA